MVLEAARVGSLTACKLKRIRGNGMLTYKAIYLPNFGQTFFG